MTSACRHRAVHGGFGHEHWLPLSRLDKIRSLPIPLPRVTEPTLDVLAVFLRAHAEGRRVHGWDIKKATGRSGPTVYGVIDRLQDAGWIEGEWEQQASDDSRPRRRMYKLQGSAVPAARALMAERRPVTAPLRHTRLRAVVPGFGGLQ